MNPLDKLSQILFHPAHFFANLKRETDISTAVTYLAVLGFIQLLLGSIVNYVLGSFYYDMFQKLLGIPLHQLQQTVPMLMLSVVFGYISLLVMSFAAAGLLHGYIYLCGGKSSYTKTYQLYVYSQVPRLVFGWIPFVNLVAGLYDLVLLIIGTEKVHGVKKNTALLMYMIPFVLFYAFVAIVLIFGISFVQANPELLQTMK